MNRSEASRSDESESPQLEHDPEKWVSVFGKRSCSKKKLERDGDSKKSHPALTIERDTVFVRSDAPRENTETSQLRVLCVGIAGLIVVDVLILAYFWTI